MKLYRKFIRPMHSYPGPDYSHRVTPIEAEVKWYPEEEREQLGNKYASYDEGSFSDLIFEEKYEPYAIEFEDSEQILALLKEQEAVEYEWIYDAKTLEESLVEFGVKIGFLTPEKAEQLLKEQPQIVRCKECGFAFYKEGLVQEGHIFCTKPGTERGQAVKPDDWFCADGEHKEGG